MYEEKGEISEQGGILHQARIRVDGGYKRTRGLGACATGSDELTVLDQQTARLG